MDRIAYPEWGRPEADVPDDGRVDLGRDDITEGEGPGGARPPDQVQRHHRPVAVGVGAETNLVH